MNKRFSTATVLATCMAVLCCPAPAEEKEAEPLTEAQKELAAGFHAALPELISALHAATAELSKLRDTAGADAAATAIRRVSAAEAQVMAAAEKLTSSGASVDSLYHEAELARALSSIPSAAYNKQVQQVLAAGCHGSVRLYLALAEDTTTYTAEQLAAQLTPADRADLQQIEDVLKQLREISPVSHWRPLEDAFVQSFDASLPAAVRLEQKPLTAMLLRRLLEQYGEHLFELCQHSFHSNGDLEERFVLHPENYIGRYYSQRALLQYFRFRGQEWNSELYHRLGKPLWEAAAPRLADFRKKYDLGKGDGRTPETAFDIPEGVTDYKEFVNTFTREVFGERHLYCEFRYGDIAPNGRLVIYGLVNAGRTGNRNMNNDPIIAMPCYFNADKKETPQ